MHAHPVSLYRQALIIEIVADDHDDDGNWSAMQVEVTKQLMHAPVTIQFCIVNRYTQINICMKYNEQVQKWVINIHIFACRYVYIVHTHHIKVVKLESLQELHCSSLAWELGLGEEGLLL